jgi:GntR family transcriptional regulator, transcriptional repressor for pyruvate dehydrogenase complex
MATPARRQPERMYAPHGVPISRPADSPAPVRELKTSEVIALEIVRSIASGGLGTGDRLPTETDMLAQYGVSRESLREALRLLEVQGLITLKRGPGGGPLVGSVDPVYLARTATLYFHMCGATYDELVDTWLLTEPLLAEKAATNPDRVLVRTSMKPYFEQTSGARTPGFIAAATGFHAVIPTLAGNRVFSLLLEAVGCIMVEHILRDLDPHVISREIDEDHDAIARAISAGQGTKARKLMAEHIQRIADHYREHYPERLQDVIEWR